MTPADFVKSYAEYHAGLEYFDHRFRQLLNVRGVKFHSFELAYVGDVTFTLMTSYSCCGDTDYDDHVFPLSDLDVDVEELNQRQNARIAKERADEAEARNRRLAEDAARAEAKDRKDYERLKAKYGRLEA